MQTENNKNEPSVLNITLSTATITRWLVYFVAIIHTLNAIAVWFRYEVGYFRFKDIFVEVFQVSSEGKFPTWYSACTLFICSILLLVISTAKRRTNDRYVLHWFGLALIFALMSFDEAAVLHEMLSPVIRGLLELSRSSFFWGWEIAGLLFLMVFGIFYFRFLLALDSRARILFIASGTTYVFGVIGVNIIGGAYQSEFGADLIYGIIASIEEVFEMAGIVMFIYALMDYLQRYYRALSISFGA
jgi:hypothetical protein